MADSSIDAAVQALVDSNNGILEVSSVENKDGVKVNRIKCTATGHEMPPRADIVTAHLNSKRFKKATEWYSYDFAQFEPYIVAHRRKPKCLYCNVTGIVLNKIPAEVEKHMKGKKFLRMKEHVKFFDEAEIDKDDDDFDANKFEFLNRQLVGSDDEEDSSGESDDEDAPKRKRKGGKKGNDSDEDIDAIFYKDHSDEEGDDIKSNEEGGIESDIAADDDDERPKATFVKKSAATSSKLHPKRKQASSAVKPTKKQKK